MFSLTVYWDPPESKHLTLTVSSLSLTHPSLFSSAAAVLGNNLPVSLSAQEIMFHSSLQHIHDFITQESHGPGSSTKLDLYFYILSRSQLCSTQ